MVLENSSFQISGDFRAADTSSVEEREVVAKVNRNLVPLFFCLGLVCYLDRTNLSFAAIQLNRDLGLSCSVYGLGAGLFFLSYSTGQVPSNMILARVGAPLWLSSTVVAWGVVAASFSLITGAASFLTLRVVLGLAECSTFPGIWLQLSKFYTPLELGTAYAKVASSTALAQVIGAPLAAGILTLDGAFGLRGWQWLFLTEGLTTIIFGVALRFLLAPSPAEARFLTPAERSWLQRRQDVQPTARSEEGGMQAELQAVLGVLRNWRVWYLAICNLAVTISLYGVIFFAPMMIHMMFDSGHQYSQYSAPSASPALEGQAANSKSCSSEGGMGGGSGAVAALMSMLPFAAAAAAMVLNAKHAEAANERRRHTGVPIGLGALCMALAPITLRYMTPATAFVSLTLAVAAIWSVNGVFNSWPATFLRGPEAAAGFAVINSLVSVGGILGPALLGVLADRFGGYKEAMLALAVLLAISAVGFLLFPEPAREEPALPTSSNEGMQLLHPDVSTPPKEAETM